MFWFSGFRFILNADDKLRRRHFITQTENLKRDTLVQCTSITYTQTCQLYVISIITGNGWVIRLNQSRLGNYTLPIIALLRRVKTKGIYRWFWCIECLSQVIPISDKAETLRFRIRIAGFRYIELYRGRSVQSDFFRITGIS